jgi:hypothetical protein
MNPTQPCSANDGQTQNSTGFQCRLVVLQVGELCPHPSYIRHQLSASASHLSALAARGDLAFREPIVVTRNGFIIDGYARWELARRQGRQTILCLEYELSEEDALRWLIQSHRPSRGFSGYCRSLLALDLEPSLQEAARANQRKGGQTKGSSTLTKAPSVDVRSEIAAVASVSSGTFSKAKQVAKAADPTIQQAVKAGEISVHKAWQWNRLAPQQQVQRLEEYRSSKGTNLVSRRLIQKHVARMLPTQLFPPRLGDLLKPLIPDRLAVLESILVSEIDAPGRAAYFTAGAIDALRSKEDAECKNETS